MDDVLDGELSVEELAERIRQAVTRPQAVNMVPTGVVLVPVSVERGRLLGMQYAKWADRDPVVQSLRASISRRPTPDGFVRWVT